MSANQSLSHPSAELYLGSVALANGHSHSNQWKRGSTDKRAPGPTSPNAIYPVYIWPSPSTAGIWLSYINCSEYAKPGWALLPGSRDDTTCKVRTNAEAETDSWGFYRGVIQKLDPALFNLRDRTMRPVRIDTRLGANERIAQSCRHNSSKTCGKHSVAAMMSLIGDSPVLGEELRTEMAMSQHMRSADHQNTYGQWFEFRRSYKAGPMDDPLRALLEASERSAGSSSFAPSSAGDASAPENTTRSPTRDRYQNDQWQRTGWWDWCVNAQSWGGGWTQHMWDKNDTRYQKWS